MFTCGWGFFLSMVVHNLRRCSGRRSDSVVPFVTPVVSGILGGKTNAVELCNLVLTTSNGHVTIAPTVPAVLWKKGVN